MVDSPYAQDPGPNQYAYGPPPRQGLSTGAKVAIGCGVAVLVVIIGLGIIGFLFYRTFEKTAGSMRAHQEASATFTQLAEEYPFEPPADGVVSAGQVQVFFEVTEDVWREIEPYVDEINALAVEMEARAERGEEEASFGEVMSGMKSMGRLLRMRLVLAESLERHRISNDEYVWTGSALMDAYKALSDPDAFAPEANLEQAQLYMGLLAELEGEDERMGKWIVPSLASILGTGAELWELMENKELESVLQ
jgi:hypothetical protein